MVPQEPSCDVNLSIIIFRSGKAETSFSFISSANTLNDLAYMSLQIIKFSCLTNNFTHFLYNFKGMLIFQNKIKGTSMIEFRVKF